MPFRPETKCFLFAWIPAGGAWVMLSSALIAGLELSPSAQGCGLACTLDVADAVSPPAKLAFGATLGALMLAARRNRPQRWPAMAVRDAAAAAIAMALVLGLLPYAWSAGFGGGLFGSRFALFPAAIYLATAAIAGLVGTKLERSCRRKLWDTHPGDS